MKTENNPPTPSSPALPDASPSPLSHTPIPYQAHLFSKLLSPLPEGAHARHHSIRRGYVGQCVIVYLAYRGRDGGCCQSRRGLLRGPIREGLRVSLLFKE